jgi:hypothetical protein
MTTKIFGGRDELASGGDDVGQQRFAANLVQDFGPLRLESRSLARRHDDYRQLSLALHVLLPNQKIFCFYCSFSIESVILNRG